MIAMLCVAMLAAGCLGGSSSSTGPAGGNGNGQADPNAVLAENARLKSDLAKYAAPVHYVMTDADGKTHEGDFPSDEWTPWMPLPPVGKHLSFDSSSEPLICFKGEQGDWCQVLPGQSGSYHGVWGVPKDGNAPFKELRIRMLHPGSASIKLSVQSD